VQTKQPIQDDKKLDFRGFESSTETSDLSRHVSFLSFWMLLLFRSLNLQEMLQFSLYTTPWSSCCLQ